MQTITNAPWRNHTIRIAAGPGAETNGLIALNRLRGHQPVSIQVRHVGLHHPVILRAKPKRDLSLPAAPSAARKGVTLPSTPIFRRDILALLPKEHLDVVATQYCKSRRNFFRAKESLSVAAWSGTHRAHAIEPCEPRQHGRRSRIAAPTAELSAIPEPGTGRRTCRLRSTS